MQRKFYVSQDCFEFLWASSSNNWLWDHRHFYSQIFNNHGYIFSLQKHAFVLKPVFAQAKMKRNASTAPLLAKDGPRFDVEFILEDISLSLSDRQLSAFLMLLEEMQRYFKMQKNISFRPEVPISHRLVSIDAVDF